MSIQRVVSKAPTELYALVKRHNMRMMKFTNMYEKVYIIIIQKIDSSYKKNLLSCIFILYDLYYKYFSIATCSIPASINGSEVT